MMQSYQSHTHYIQRARQRWSLILKHTGSMWHVSASLTLSLTINHVSDFTFLCTACQLSTAVVCMNTSSLLPCLTLNTCCRIITLLLILSVFLSSWDSHTNKHMLTGSCIHAHSCTYTPAPACIIPDSTWSSVQVSLSFVLCGRLWSTLHLAPTCHILCLPVCQVRCCFPWYSKYVIVRTLKLESLVKIHEYKQQT